MPPTPERSPGRFLIALFTAPLLAAPVQALFISVLAMLGFQHPLIKAGALTANLFNIAFTGQMVAYPVAFLSCLFLEFVLKGKSIRPLRVYALTGAAWAMLLVPSWTYFFVTNSPLKYTAGNNEASVWVIILNHGGDWVGPFVVAGIVVAIVFWQVTYGTAAKRQVHTSTGSV